MFMFCATAAPMRHPPGEAHSLPAAKPLVTTFASRPLPVNRACETSSRRLAAHPHPHAAFSVVAPVVVSDAATPIRPTTFDSCRQKRMRRHQATRDTTHRRRLSGSRSNQHGVELCQFAAVELVDMAGSEAKAFPSLNAATITSASRTAFDFCRQKRVSRQNGRIDKNVSPQSSIQQRASAQIPSLSPRPQTNIMTSLPALAAFGGEQVSTG